MLSRIFQLLLAVCLVTSSVWAAANDSFLGKWKVNPSTSKLNDEMKVEVAGANRYAITFGTLNDAFTQYLPDGMTLFSQSLPNGSTLFLPYAYERTAGNSGFTGTWDSESAKVRTGMEIQVQPYEGDGLSFKRSDEEMVERIKLDGNDHPDLDPNGGDKGTAYSGRQVNARSLEIKYKFKGIITRIRQIEFLQISTP